MLLIPPTLGLVHQLKFILEQPFVICALDNRARLARNLLAALLFIAFRAVMAVSIPSIALGALLFRGGKPCTWESGASYYAYMTGQTLITPVKTGSLIVWQAMTIWLTVLLVSILFLSINLSCESHQLGSILSWGVCLLALWMCSFPVTPKLYRLQKSVSFSVNRIAENTVWRHFLSGICILFLESLFLHFAVTRKDFFKVKNSFIRLLLRDIKNYIRTNRFFLIAEAALFLIGCMIADMQKPDSYGKYTTIQYYMQIFRGCYPFTDARTEVFQVPLTWFTLMYFCIYTALLYPIRDASGAGIHVLLRAKSRALWWFSKCLALTVWNLLYFAVGFCSVCVFCFFTNGLSCFTILPYDVLPCDALTCLLPFGFALAISLLAFCLCIFCSFVWGQVFAISCLVAVSFTEFPSPFLCYAMLIRCRAMSPAGFDERAGLLFYLIFAGIVCFIGMFLFLQLDLFPGLQRRPQ